MRNFGGYQITLKSPFSSNACPDLAKIIIQYTLLYHSSHFYYIFVFIAHLTLNKKMGGSSGLFEEAHSEGRGF